MGRCRFKISPFIITVAAALSVTAAIILCAVYLGNYTLTFNAEYYFICYAVRDNSISADAISESVSSYGGAGYVLEYGGEYYVTVSCYYTENEASRVKQSLLRRGLNCSVLKIETDEYPLQSSARNKEKLYLGNLNTLNSLSKLCYECANGLDTGSYSQSAAKSVLKDILSGLDGLSLSNTENCFSGEIRRLIAECKSVGDGYILSKNMRKLQIAIADTVINIKLY